MISLEQLEKWKYDIDNDFYIDSLSDNMQLYLRKANIFSLKEFYNTYKQFTSFEDAYLYFISSKTNTQDVEYVIPLLELIFEFDKKLSKLHENFSQDEIKLSTTDFRKIYLWLIEDNPKLSVMKELEIYKNTISKIEALKDEDLIEDVVDSSLDTINIDDFKWRTIQIKGIDNFIQSDYKSGLNVLIMGSGKSFMILNEIQHKYNHDVSKGRSNLVYVILTDRKEILKDLFYKYDEGNSQYYITPDKDKWKKREIIDLDNFELITSVLDKRGNIIDVVNSTSKPVLLVINTAYLRTNQRYRQIKANRLSCVWVDECHLITGNQTYKALEYVRWELGVECVGFSATPVRPNSKKSEERLKRIFSNDGEKVNMFCFYSLFDALKDNTILPFRHIIVEGKPVRNRNNRIDKEILNEILQKEVMNNNDLPYKKGIAWCSRIDDVRPNNGSSFYDFFRQLDFDVYYSTCQDEKNHRDLDTFYKKESEGILLCVNKCREGSDIKNLDYCLYLNKVKKRSLLVALQTSGRVMRPDKEGKKKCALIIECIVKDNNKSVEAMTANKVLEYYKAILKLGEGLELHDPVEMLNLLENTYINKEEKTVEIKVDNDPSHNCVIKLDIKDLDWSKLMPNLTQQVQQEVFQDELAILNYEYEQAVKNNQKYNILTKVEYNQKVDFYDLVTNPEHKFSQIWKGWYDYLGVDTSNYPKTLEEWKAKLLSLGIQSKHKYIQECTVNKLPLMPEELYHGFRNFDTELNNQLILV